MGLRFVATSKVVVSVFLLDFNGEITKVSTQVF